MWLSSRYQACGDQIAAVLGIKHVAIRSPHLSVIFGPFAYQTLPCCMLFRFGSLLFLEVHCCRYACFHIAHMSSRKRSRDAASQLSPLVNLSAVSDSALAKILKVLSTSPCEAFSRKTIHKAAVADYTPDVAYKINLKMAEGGEDFVWELLRPQALLDTCTRVSEGFRSLFRGHRMSPEHPWHLILYHDELTPGDLLAAEQNKKHFAFYFSFREFGQAALSHECCWLPVAILRSSIARGCVGGVSAVCKLIIRLFFFGRESFLSTGVVIDAGDGPFLFFAELGNVLGDEGALQATYNLKGASGLRLCLKCHVLGLDSEIVCEDASGRLVDITCGDTSRFIARSDDQVWRQFDTLKAMHQSWVDGETFRLKGISYGLTFNPDGLLADLECRQVVGPTSTYTSDWVHQFLQGGCASVQFFLLRIRLQSIDIHFADMHALCKAPWKWPVQMQHIGKRCSTLFTESRKKVCQTNWKSTCTELLTVMPLVLHFLQSVVSNLMLLGPEIECFRKLCHAIDCIQALKHGDCDFGRCHTAIEDSFNSFVEVYGTSDLLPKFHYMLHDAAQFLRDQLVLDTLTVERKHQEPKMVANKIDNTDTFEKSVVARMLSTQFRSLSEYDPRAGLRGKTVEWPLVSRLLGDPNAQLSESLVRQSGDQVWKGEIIFANGNVFVVEVCGITAGRLFVLGRAGELTTRLSPTSASWKIVPGLKISFC